ISVQPVSQTKCSGNSVTFSVTASGTSLTYQWRKDGANIGGATASSYTIASVATSDAASTPGYDCVVSAAAPCASVTSSAATLTVISPPSISGQPASATKCVGDSVTFSVTANNAAGYQWRKNGVNIGGATASSYTIASVVTGDAASYDCVVSGNSPCASVTSSAAT